MRGIFSPSLPRSQYVSPSIISGAIDEISSAVNLSFTSERSANHLRALILARHGFKVFPCRHEDGIYRGELRKRKHPLVNWKAQASSDQNRINSWWKSFPDALVAIKTGKSAGVNGIVVIDLDEKDGKSAQRSIQALSLPNDPAISLRTSNNGLHAFYSYPEGFELIKSTADLFGKVLGSASGIDSRADGGFVIVYDDPWKLINSVLTPLPPEYLKELDDKPNPRPSEPKGAVSQTVDMEELNSALERISPNLCRVDWIKVGSALKGILGNGGFTVWNSWSAGSRKHFEPEMQRVWNGLSGRARIGTIFYYARKEGWQPKQSHMMAKIREIAHEKVKTHRDFGDLQSILETEIATQFSFLPEHEVKSKSAHAADFVSKRYVSDEEYRAARSEEGKIGNEVKKSRRRARGEVIASEAKPWVQLGVSRRTYYRNKMQPGVVSDVFYNSEMADQSSEERSDRKTDACVSEASAKRCLHPRAGINRRECHETPSKCNTSVKHSVKHSKEEVADAFGISRMTLNRWERDGIPSRQLKVWQREGVLDERLAEWAKYHDEGTPPKPESSEDVNTSLTLSTPNTTLYCTKSGYEKEIARLMLRRSQISSVQRRSESRVSDHHTLNDCILK